ncbi:Ribosomal protein L7a [Fasciola hepatica]|uniref:60S ribosomal protein L7a n=1 Tax=Fasciola hepatica TaxID=6192 RepID=A0A4E0RAM7_FASHE|nr:Ribosomal protein L7a [Fasciola hepatica]
MPNKPKKVIKAKKIKEIVASEPVVPSLKKGKASKVAALPEIAKKTAAKKKIVKNPLIQRRPRNFGIGQDIQPKRDLYRFVKWPKYVELQRKRAILKRRLKVPPPIHQFSQTLDRATCKTAFLFHLLQQCRYSILQKSTSPSARERRKCCWFTVPSCEPMENQTSQWLGNRHCVLESVKEDKSRISKVVETVKNNYSARYEEIRKHWGGGILGAKSQARITKLEKAKAKELQIKLG